MTTAHPLLEINDYKGLTKYQEYMNNDFCLCCAYFVETKGHFGFCPERKDKKPFDGSKKGTGKAMCWRLKSVFRKNNIEFELSEIVPLVRVRAVVRPKNLMRQWIKPRSTKPKPKRVPKPKKERVPKPKKERAPRIPKVKEYKPTREQSMTARHCATCPAVFIVTKRRKNQTQCAHCAIKYRNIQKHLNLDFQEQKEKIVADDYTI